MENKNHTGVFLGLIVATCMLSTAFAADAPAEASPPAAVPVDVEVFKGVQIRSSPISNYYPIAEVHDGREGWVVLNTMIDPKGKPYEVMVVDSSGNRAFEKAALAAIKQMGFEPAQRAGTPIDSSYTFKMKFAISGLAQGGSSEFAAAYRRFTKAVHDGDKAKADAALARLEAENLYEEAFMNFGKFQYHYKWGTPEEQRAALNRAIAGEEKPTYLPKDVFTGALFALFRLELGAHDYGEAMETWARLEPLASPELRQGMQEVVDKLRAAKLATNQPIRRPATLSEDGDWHTTLFRNRFSIVVSSGTVSEIKLRCAQQYLLFKYQPDVQYSIGTKKDHCGIEVIGDPGTKFDLVQ